MTGPGAARWAGLAADALAARWGLPRLLAFEEVDSTSDVARELARLGAPALSTAIAERQRAGRGRLGRQWSSPPGLGLWFSMLARPGTAADAGALPLLVGLGVAEALDAFLPGGAGIKWPNDLVASGRKLGGILCEGGWDATGQGWVVVGVGINAGHAAGDFPEALRGVATSLAIESGRTVDRVAVADAVVPAVARVLSGPLSLDADRLGRLAARDALRGSEVVVSEPAAGRVLARGTAEGIAPDGALLLRDAGGVRALRSGTVRPVGTGG